MPRSDSHAHQLYRPALPQQVKKVRELQRVLGEAHSPQPLEIGGDCRTCGRRSGEGYQTIGDGVIRALRFGYAVHVHRCALVRRILDWLDVSADLTRELKVHSAAIASADSLAGNRRIERLARELPRVEQEAVELSLTRE